MSRRYIHICNQGTPPNDTVYRQLPSQAVFDEFCKEPPPEDAVYLIYINLNWDGKALSSDYGFDIANELRIKHRSLAPIIFYSFAPLKYFEFKADTSHKREYKLLYGRGSAFLPAPFSSDELVKAANNTPALTAASWTDLITSLGSLRGLMLQTAHDIKPGKDIASLLEFLDSCLSPKQFEAIYRENFRGQLIEFSSGGDQAQFIVLREEFLKRCLGALGEEDGDVESPTPDPITYKILVVEDDEEDLELARSYLSKYFRVIPERRAIDAIKRLSEDVRNEIAAVICDWRLYESGTKYWQPYQGYEVLEEASKTQIRGLFSLTSQPDPLVHQIRNQLGVPIQLIKKEDFLRTRERTLFIEWIKNACENRSINEASIPTGDPWKNEDAYGRSYRSEYIQLRNSFAWETFLLYVQLCADEIWSYILEHKKKGEKIPNRFGIRFRSDTKDLHPVLVLRLMWFGLWYKFGLKFEAYEDEMRDGIKEIWKYFAGPEKKGQVNNEMSKACLHAGDIRSSRLFPHEKAWLSRWGLLDEEVSTPEATIHDDVTPISEGPTEEFGEEEQIELMQLRLEITEAVNKWGGTVSAEAAGVPLKAKMIRLRQLVDLEMQNRSVSRSDS